MASAARRSDPSHSDAALRTYAWVDAEIRRAPNARLVKLWTEFTAEPATRSALLDLVEEELAARRARRQATPRSAENMPPEAWRPEMRGRANIQAMRILADRPNGPFNAADRLALARYSGWGGLSIERYAEEFPEELPRPEARGLVHEFYTPLKVWRAVADTLRPFQSQLAGADGVVRALEPSAGIGRALLAFDTWRVRWQAVEASRVSSLLLRALYGATATTFEGFFEGWLNEPQVRDALRAHEPLFDLIVSNPPYGARGAARELDPNGFPTKRAAIYFVFRSLDLLRPEGVGVYLIPTGLMTGTGPEYAGYRRELLRRAHLMAAFRLPSETPPGVPAHEAVYPSFVTDLVFVRRRAGRLRGVLPADQRVADGHYFADLSRHVLGEPVGEGEGWEPGQPKPRRGFQVVGRFQGLPAWTERPRPEEQGLEDYSAAAGNARGGLERVVRAPQGPLPPAEDAAVRLGLRGDAWLAAVARQEPAAVDGWAELHADLVAWREAHGSPRDHEGLYRLERERITGAERFLALWGRDGRLIEPLRQPPEVVQRFAGEWSLVVVADWLYRQQAGVLTVDGLCDWWRAQGAGDLTASTIIDQLLPAGWALDGARWDELVPDRVYYTGFLWPRYDRAKQHAEGGDPAATRQVERLRDTIGWRSGVALLPELAPSHSWIPLNLIEEWLETWTLVPNSAKPLKRDDGLLVPGGKRYAALDNTEERRTPGYSRDLLSFFGYANVDLRLWNPEREKVRDPDTGKEAQEPVTEARKKQTAAWEKSFRNWLGQHPERLDALEEAYNREIRGYVAPSHTDEPIPIARWGEEVRLRSHQIVAARRALANRSGLLALDVGLGKTYTAIAIVARARQEGWARRPVVLVPNSVVWKWYRDFARCLPDYRVLVIGSERRIAKSGPRKGRLIAERDTPEARAQKWTHFQAGGADVVLLAYSALATTKIDAEFVAEYVEGTASLRRQIALNMRNDERRSAKAPTERQQAVMEEQTRAWVGELLAPPKTWRYDPGIDWHHLGVDLMVVDEAQNFKNLFKGPDEAEKADTKRSWQLDFRLASVRKHSGGAGVVLLSATPAKNSPVEFYTMIHYIRPDAWAQVGIDNPISWVQRFCQIEERIVPTVSGGLAPRPVVTRFMNLDEMRDVLARWAEFKVAEEVGLKLPEAIRKNHHVPVTPEQGRALFELWGEMAELEEKITKASHNKSDEGERILRILMDKRRTLSGKIYLSYIHAELPGIGDDKQAISRVDPHDAPKLVACVKEIMATAERVCRRSRPDQEPFCLQCAHIVFVENVAPHYWLKALLVEAGLPAERIAILNAIEAKDIEFRQQIVEGFNGVGDPEDEEFTPPIYDVVIANAVAYEGVDLQRRTCAIHHLDVPWEPATLQQRNGRGVRQGNQFERVTLHYYFVQGSNEIHRIDRIERKRGWMSSVVASQARATNTTLENDSSEEDLEDLALAHARPEDRERIQRARREQAAALKEARARDGRVAANTELRNVSMLYRRAERERDPVRAGQLRSQADTALAALRSYPAELWPSVDWHARAARVREMDIFVPEAGPPLAPGDIVGPRERELRFEVGLVVDIERRVNGRDTSRRGVHVRDVSTFGFFNEWTEELDLTERSLNYERPGVTDEEWSQFRERARSDYHLTHVGQNIERIGDLQLHVYSPQAQREIWTVLEPIVAKVRLGKHQERAAVPFELGEALGVVSLATEVSAPPPGAELLPPTPEGWARFQGLADRSEIPWAICDAAARFWWHRRYPKGRRGQAEEEDE